MRVVESVAVRVVFERPLIERRRVWSCVNGEAGAVLQLKLVSAVP